MKRHVLHPLWFAIAIVVTVLVARVFLVPEDFGVHGDSFTYHFYRESNVQEWQDFEVKYQGMRRCGRCHRDNYNALRDSVHREIECENCHGPGVGHPKLVENLEIRAEREHCLRCHQSLPYPSSLRASLPAVNGDKHGRQRECRRCHDPHNPHKPDREESS